MRPKRWRAKSRVLLGPGVTVEERFSVCCFISLVGKDPIFGSASVPFLSHVWEILKYNFSFFPSVPWFPLRAFLFYVSVYNFTFRFCVFASFFLLFSFQSSAVTWRGPSTSMLTNCHSTAFSFRFQALYSQVRPMRELLMASSYGV